MAWNASDSFKFEKVDHLLVSLFSLVTIESCVSNLGSFVAAGIHCANGGSCSRQAPGMDSEVQLLGIELSGIN